MYETEKPKRVRDRIEEKREKSQVSGHPVADGQFEFFFLFRREREQPVSSHAGENSTAELVGNLPGMEDN